MKRAPIPCLASLIAGLMLILALNNGALVRAQTPTPTSIPSPTSIPTVFPSPPTLGYDQALSTYKEIATEVIKSAERVLDITKWIVAGIFSLIGLAGGAILYISRTAGQAKDSAARSAQAAKDSKGWVEKLETRVQDTLTQIQATQADLERTRKQMELLHHDLSRMVPRLVAMADVDSYAVRLLSADDRISRTAKRALIELSKDEGPVVRYKCVRVFGAMPDYPECFIDLQDPLIVSRLQQMALEDPERGVQLEARLALKRLGVDLGDE